MTREKEKERLRREAGVVAEVKKKRPNKISMKGTEKVDSTILKVLGKSPKSKVTLVAKGRCKSEAPKVVAQEQNSSRILRKITHEKMQQRKKRLKFPEKKTGKNESQVIKIMRRNLKPGSFRLWRKRVHNTSIKHRKKFKLSRKKMREKIKISDIY